jgi:hypothetical protein
VAKRGSLSNFTATKPEAASEPSPPAAKEPLRGQTLRLNRAAWAQLKGLAIEQATPSHTLLIEAVNDLFRKHGKPTIA